MATTGLSLRPRGTAGTGAVLALAATLLAPVATHAVCDSSTLLTLLAVDTTSRQFLFALSGAEDTGRRLLRVTVGAAEAEHFPDSLHGRRVGASHGPGPFLVTRRCGPQCVQPLVWRDGDWIPLGGSVAVRDDAAIHATYDGDGNPWLTAHRATGSQGVVEVSAWSLEQEEWTGRGALHVQAVGTPGARPDRRRTASILSGTGRFAIGEKPSYWLPKLPLLDDSTSGQLERSGGTTLLLAHDSRLYRTDDDGETWRRERWSPWTAAGRSRPAASAHWIDTAVSLSPTTVPVLWFDDRSPTRSDVRLTRRLPGGGWVEEAALPRGANAPLAIDHVLDLGPGRWLVLGPCADDGPPALRAITVEEGGVSAPFAIPLRRGR